LIFKTGGNFVQQDEDVPLSTAQIEKLILPDKSRQYLVDLTKNVKTKEVIFTADGAVICEQK